ncbi:hypothetical protein MBLNU13_g09004t3 [Cladosporium sp. NU13]
MVQFKTVDIEYRNSLAWSTHAWPDSYWKLGLNSYRNRTIREPGVVDAIGRYHRGLMSYEGRTVDELRAFCKARGLPTKATTASGLARALEKADDLATCSRFFDLPAGIRNVVYELHFDDFDAFKEKFVQPPLTLASKQLRSEALPLFYNCATFGLTAGYDLPRGPKHVQLDFLSFMKMPTASFARIPKFDHHWRDTAAGIKVEVAIRFISTSELVDPISMYLTLPEALQIGLESKSRTVQNTREMLESGDQPLTLSISGDWFNTVHERVDQVGWRVRVGALALRSVKFE